MTNTITFRSKRSKRELRERLGPNLSAALNDLVESRLASSSDWREILNRPRPQISDRIYETCLQPE